MNTEIPGYCNEAIPVPRVLCHSLTGVTEFPGKGMRIFQNFQNFRVRVRMSYRTYRSSGYCGTGVQSTRKVRGGARRHAVPVLRVLRPRACRTSRSSGYRYECRTELTEVLGTGMNAVQNLQKFFVGQYPPLGTVCTYPHNLGYFHPGGVQPARYTFFWLKKFNPYGGMTRAQVCRYDKRPFHAPFQRRHYNFFLPPNLVLLEAR